MYIMVPISPGELLDKVSILEVKTDHFIGEKLGQVKKELELLGFFRTQLLSMSTEINDLYLNLRLRNRWLFNAENDIRGNISHLKVLEEVNDESQIAMEQLGIIVSDIKTIHKWNKERAEYKAEINKVCGSTLNESKQYATQEG